MDFKEELRVAYNMDAQRRLDSEPKKEDWKINARGDFANLVITEEKESLLELGAGVGTDSAYFKSLELDVLAVDLSESMVETCQEKGLDAQILDLYEIPKLEKQFDAIYSMNVLLHVPRNDLPYILELISAQLREDGLFFYGVYGGENTEKIITDNTKMGLPRFFSFLSNETLLAIAKQYFDLVSFKTIDIGSKDPNFYFQSLILRKKSP